MGLVLRGAFVWEIEWLDYRNMMHGHSHVAMLGWIYMALYSLIWSRFIPKEKRKNPFFSRLFWFTQMTVVGMMISFPLQGYAAVSITFSSLHILASYAFIYKVWKALHIQSAEVALLLKTSLILLMLSTIGVWSLGPINILGGRNSALYQVAIQFYLHFQFHGWFTFAVMALLFDALNLGKPAKSRDFKWFYSLLLAATVLTYGLIITWGYGTDLYLIFNGVGLAFQVLALLLFFKMARQRMGDYLKEVDTVVRILYQFGLVSWVLKVLIQATVVFPKLAEISLTIRSLMIGFIHLTMLGFISGLLFALVIGGRFLPRTNPSLYAGVMVFILGFALTELILFVQGLFYWFQWGQVPGYYVLIFAASIFLPIGISMIIFHHIKTLSQYKHENNYLLS